MQAESASLSELQRQEFEERMQRVRQAVGARNDSELARALGIKPQSIGPARKRCQIPPRWIRIISEQFQTSSDWLFFGISGVSTDVDATRGNAVPTHPVALKNELDEERAERRALSQELLKLTATLRRVTEENATLWHENHTARERVHALECELARLNGRS